VNIVPPEIEDYAAAHTEGLHPVYEALREVTYAKTSAPQMQVGHLEGRFLKLMAQLTGARRAVEIGTFTGYSGLCIAEGMADDGVLTTLDVDATTTAIAKAHWAQVPWGKKITSILGPAIESLGGIEGPIDLAFIDADKESYVAYWDALVPKMRKGGVIVADNVLWSGRVLAPQRESDHAIVAFNRRAASDPRVEKVMLTVRDGLLVARVK
jgi:caffeoyl-CoA O-methyltransferase